MIQIKEPWIVLYLQGKELYAVTVRGGFPGEIASTKEQLAAENHCSPEEIQIKIVDQ